MRTVSKKKAVAEYEEKKFKLAFFDPAADKTFCPNVNVIFTSNTPEGASEYCFSDSNDPSQTCEWKSLPLDIKFKASSENQTLKKYLLFRNSEKVVLNETWESNELSVKPSTIAKTEADQIRQLKTDELTENQMDEYLCRMDEWSYNVAKNIAMNVSDSFTQDRRVDMSHQLARMYYGDYGVSVKMSKDQISKIGWRLIVHTQEPAMVMYQEHSRWDGSGFTRFVIPNSLEGFDVSFINFKKRNIQHLNFKGTNLRGEQLNEIDSLSTLFSVSGLDLKNWKPATVKNVEGVDFSFSKDPPWSTINQLTTLNYLNLSGLDLTNWQPSTTFTSGTNLNLSYATNIPFDRINAMTTFNYAKVDLSYTNLSGWLPAPTVSLWDLNLNYASNIPWTYINANSHANGFGGLLLNGLDLSQWTPASTKDISGIDLKNAYNIPWIYLNANTFSEGFRKCNFEGLDLSSFSPLPPSSIRNASFQNAKNINWTSLNANTHADGFAHINLNGLDLTSWNPSTSRPVGASLVNSTNIPWDLINSNVNATGTTGLNLEGLDLSKWSPTPSQPLNGVVLKNTKNIPWTKINLSSTVRFADFSGLDLANWSPVINVDLLGLDLTDSKNIPWAILNTNIHGNGFQSVKLTNLDLSEWKPSPTTQIQGLVLARNNNIPWQYLNANTIGFSTVVFIKTDLSNLDPVNVFGMPALIYKSRNIPWQKIVNKEPGTTHSLASGYTFPPYYHLKYSSAVNLEGFIPKHGYTITPPYGARSVQDFEEAAETSGYRGVRWGLDNSYPWGF